MQGLNPMPDPDILHLLLAMQRLAKLRPLYKAAFAPDIALCHKLINEYCELAKDLTDDLEQAHERCERIGMDPLTSAPRVWDATPPVVCLLKKFHEMQACSMAPKICYRNVVDIMKGLHDELCELNVHMCDHMRPVIEEKVEAPTQWIGWSSQPDNNKNAERAFSHVTEKSINTWSRVIHEERPGETVWDTDI